MAHGWQAIVLGSRRCLLVPYAVFLTGWHTVGAHLEPNDALARLHGGVIGVPSLLLRALDADVHATLQSQTRHLHLLHVSALKVLSLNRSTEFVPELTVV